MSKRTQNKPNQTQPVVSLPALSLPVPSAVEGVEGSNLFPKSLRLKISWRAGQRSSILYSGQGLYGPLTNKGLFKEDAK